ncbi:MAG: ABC transporter permease subunit, partial [Phycisphaerales bacterium]|nr:ABC transporter permease subunit [Phycisphaerales bacterium]
LTAGAVVEERTARTLSALATSPLSPGRVIGGLFASRLTTLAILALLPLPLLLAIRTFGGLDTSFVLWSFAVAVCSAVATAAAGLWASTRVTRTAAGISTAVMLMLVQWAGPPLLIMLDSALHGWGPPSTLAPLIVSPPAALVLIQFPPAGIAFGFTGGEAAAVNCAVSLLIAAVALTLARWQLARLIATDRVELVKQPTRRDKRRAARAAKEGAPTGSDDAPPEHGTSRTVTGNPVLWREMRQPLFNRAWLRWVNGAFMLVLLVGIHLATLNSFFFDREALVVTPSIVGLLVLILSAAAVPAGAVTTEREAQTWATLLSSPLLPLQILLPKVAGAMRRLWYVPAFITAHLALCVARGIASPMVLPFALLHMAVIAGFLCTTGVFLSLWCRKGSAASALNLVLAVGLWVLTPIFTAIIFEIARFGRNDWLAQGYYFSHPVVTFVTGLLGLSSKGGTLNFDMPGGNVPPLQFAVGWLLSLALYAGAAGLVLGFARARFHGLSTARL